MINKKKRKRLIHIILGATTALVILFILNYYLAKKLEVFLKKELAERTSTATNGFYVLTFDSLSISLLNGELRMQGISLYPNPEILKEWQEKDSLPPVYVNAKVDLIDFEGINLIWRRDYKQLHFRRFEVREPVVEVVQTRSNDPVETERKNRQAQTLDELLSPYIDVLSAKAINLANASLSNARLFSISGVNLDIKDFKWGKNNYTDDSIAMKMEYEVNNFNASNLSIPVDDGFFTLNIGRIAFNNRNLSVDRIHYVSAYPQLEFSYKHPRHDDWFDIQVDHLEMKEINIPDLLKVNTVRAKEATVDRMTLQNMRNQKLNLPHHIVPMIYEGIQKAPLKLDIPLLHVNNFAVMYYEWAKNGETPGKLSITDVTGTVTGLTNLTSGPEPFIRIDADAKFMGTGDFSAVWLIPVKPEQDQFLIHAHLKSFNLADLNAFITPLAGAKVESGHVQDMTLDIDASSRVGTISLRLPYRDLKVDLGKFGNKELHKNGFASWLANAAVRNNNPLHPEKPGSALRESHLTITRDPYHSTFNYIWQMLSPALAESVGVSEGSQKFGKGVAQSMKNIQNFFTGNKANKDEHVVNNHK